MNSTKFIAPAALVTVLATAWFFVTPSSLTGSPTGTTFDADQKKEIEQIVREYLIANPEVLVEVSQAWQKKSQEELSAKTTQAVKAHADKLTQSTSPILGNPAGTIVLVKFLDYQCSHCKSMEPVISDLIEENPSLKVVIKELPIFGAQSEYAAKAALAAGKQKKFSTFHAALLNEKEKLSNEKVLELAKANGLDVGQLKKDIEDPALATELKQVKELATAISIRGTPFFVVLKSTPGSTDQALVLPGAGSKEQIQQLIDKVRGSAQ